MAQRRISQVELYERITLVMSLTMGLLILVTFPSGVLYYPQLVIYRQHGGAVGAILGMGFSVLLMALIYSIPMRELLRRRWFKRLFREQTIAYCLLQTYAVIVLFYTAIAVTAGAILIVHSLAA